MTRRPHRPAPSGAPLRRDLAEASAARAEPLEPRTHLSASLVADVQQGSGDASPTVLTAGGSRLFFRAWDGTTVGNEPYVLAAQHPPSQAPRATLLKDINPNGDSTFRKFSHGGPTPPTPAIAAGDGFYFSAFEQTYGLELYYTDGTAAGTRLVKDVVAGRSNSSPDNFFLAGDVLYFTAGAFGIEPGTRSLYRTDGTDAGTTVVRHVSGSSIPGAPVPLPTSMALLDGVVYFTAADGLYRIDPAGGGRVRSHSVAAGVAPPRSLVAFGGAVYYKYNDQLWRSDGTDSGTVSVRNIGVVPPTHVQAFDRFVAAGEHLYFVGNTAADGAELWRTDGTAPGTGLVKSIHDGPTGAWPNHLTDVGGTLYFTASATAGVGESVWRTDGAAETTVPVHSLPDSPLPNPAGRPFKELAAVGDTLYFTNFALGNGAGLWRTSAASPPTRVGAPFSVPQSLTPFAGRLHFVARNLDGLELWSTDGTTAGTKQTQDINARHDASRVAPEGLAAVSGRLVFATDNGVSGRRLWSAAGTNPGVLDLGPLPRAFKPVRLGDRLYFVSGPDGEELWTTDGTTAGTYKVRNFLAVAGSSGIVRLSSVAGMLLFFAADAEHGRELWASDGTFAGTRFLKEFTPGPGSTNVGEGQSWPLVVEAGGVAYFVQGAGIYKTDGTPEGTVLLRSFTSGSPNRPHAVGDRVLFTVPAAGSFRDELWFTDGTPEGTAVVNAQLTAHSFETLGDFAAFWGNGGLWRSDGTPASTYPIWEYESGVMANPNDFTAWNGALYFRSDQGMWKTDGTKAGTVPLVTADGRRAAFGGYGVPLGEHLYYSGSDAAHGTELWRTDGTDAGTVRVTDILPGPASSSPTNFVEMSDALYFFAEDGVHGREPWRYAPGLPAVTVRTRSVFYNNSAFDNRDPAATLADLTAVAPDKHALLRGGAGTFGNVTSYTRGLNGVLVDFAGIPPAPLTAADFDFRIGRLGEEAGWRAVAGASVTQLIGPIASNVARYAITFPDGAVRNTWLRVTVKANANTGLGADDVFYFGNLPGDTGSLPFRVDVIDYVRTRYAANTAAAIDSPVDFDRNGRVNANDVGTARANNGRSLTRLSTPAPTSVAPAAIASSPARRRSAYADLVDGAA